MGAAMRSSVDTLAWHAAQRKLRKAVLAYLKEIEGDPTTAKETVLLGKIRELLAGVKTDAVKP
jgi:hypothetical protein